MTTRNPKEVVARGYDAVADAYLRRFLTSTVRDEWLAELVSALPAGSHVLDLGCGAGIPVSRRLAELGHDVVGVDSSEGQLRRARARVPNARFVHADMTNVDFGEASFDGIAAFYAITHVPRAEQGLLLGKIGAWLKPGGAFVGSFGTGAAHDWTGEWLGAEMFFSQNSDATTLDLVGQAGLEIMRAEVVAQDNEDASFLWISARKPV